MKNRVIVILFFALFICCTTNSDDRIVVAQVLDNYLYLDQIPDFESKLLNSEDSLLFVYNFSNEWAAKKLLIHKAEFNLEESSIYVDSLVAIYRESLLIHYYKEALIQTYLDTIIEDSLIKNYYSDNIENFVLQEDIVKLNFIKIRNVAPNLEFVSKSYDSSDIEIIEKLEDYCLQFADRFFLGDVNWISWDVFSKQLPTNNNFFSTKNQKIELEDETYKYFIFIQDFKIKGTSSPLKYVSSVIRNILINKRKKEIVNNIEKKLIEEAISNNNFKIYE